MRHSWRADGPENAPRWVLTGRLASADPPVVATVYPWQERVSDTEFSLALTDALIAGRRPDAPGERLILAIRLEAEALADAIRRTPSAGVVGAGLEGKIERWIGRELRPLLLTLALERVPA